MKLWSGRFSKDTDKLVDELNASIGFDCRLYSEDIQGSIAHADMLGKTGVIAVEESEKIKAALADILKDIEAGAVEFTPENEDIHMNIEAILTERIGSAGKRLHTARSRNDQVAVDFRLWCKKQLAETRTMLLSLLEVLASLAEANADTVMPAYTHLQRAQPTTLGHYLLAYSCMLRRDVTRIEDCLERMDECPLGCGALTGTTYPIDRYMTAAALGFRAPNENSIDGVSDRDYALEILSALSIMMMHLSRFSEELILWCSWEFGFIEFDDSFTTGSSIMPQKKNPDVAELVRGKTGRVYGSLTSLLTVMKSLPLAYNKDMQEDKEPVFDAFDTVFHCLPVFTAMLKTMTVKADNMRAAAERGFIAATDCADYLVRKGLPFRDAYTVVGKIVNLCISSGRTLETLPIEEYRELCPLFDEDVYEAIKLETCIASRVSLGSPSPENVRRQLASLRAFIAERSQEE